MHTITMPGDSFESLSTGFVRGTADFMITHLLQQDSPRLVSDALCPILGHHHLL